MTFAKAKRWIIDVQWFQNTSVQMDWYWCTQIAFQTYCLRVFSHSIAENFESMRKSHFTMNFRSFFPFAFQFVDMRTNVVIKSTTFCAHRDYVIFCQSLLKEFNKNADESGNRCACGFMNSNVFYCLCVDDDVVACIQFHCKHFFKFFWAIFFRSEIASSSLCIFASWNTHFDLLNLSSLGSTLTIWAYWTRHRDDWWARQNGKKKKSKKISTDKRRHRK